MKCSNTLHASIIYIFIYIVYIISHLSVNNHIYLSFIIVNHINLGGSLILSDDLKQISNKRFRIMLQLLPPTNQAAIVVDLLGTLILP